MLNLIFAGCIKMKPLVVSTAFVLAVQTSTNAEQPLPRLTPAQAQNLSRDLVPHNSQDFLGKEKIQLREKFKFSGKDNCAQLNLFLRLIQYRR